MYPGRFDVYLTLARVFGSRYDLLLETFDILISFLENDFLYK